MRSSWCQPIRACWLSRRLSVSLIHALPIDICRIPTRALALAVHGREDARLIDDDRIGVACTNLKEAVCAYTGTIPGNHRLGIPPLHMNDGPQGYVDTQLPGTSTAWPSSLAMATSWDVDAVEEWGRQIGAEFYQKGANVFLGPGLNLARSPYSGRVFETLAGEDPRLGCARPRAHMTGSASARRPCVLAE